MKEDDVQKACIRWFRLQHPSKILFHVNNSVYANGLTAMKRQARLKSMGVLAGVSDLILCYRGKTTFIEVKTDKGRQSPNQKSFETKAASSGFDYHIVRSFDQFKNLIDELT